MSDTTDTGSATLENVADNSARPVGLASQPRLDVQSNRLWWERIKTRQRILIVVVEFAVIIALWQYLIGTLELVNPLFLPTPTRIVEGFGLLFGSGERSLMNTTNTTMWTHISRSAYSFLIGYLIAVIIGLPMGLLIGTSRVAYKLTGPLIWALYAVPWLALRPLATIWFGFEAAPVIFLVAFASLFPMLLNTAAGPQTVDRSVLRAAEVFGASKFKRFQKVILPSSLPFILVGLRQAIIIGIISLLVAEIVGSSKGLGSLITLMTTTFKTGAAFAALSIAVLASVILGQGMRYVAEKAAPWHFDRTRS